MKRPHESQESHDLKKLEDDGRAVIADAGDRARTHRKPGYVRVDVDKIGFWPGNRGGMGINPYHVHEVAWDCKCNKTKLERYHQVDLIEIPQDMLQEIRDANRERCEADDCMPRFSPHMTYVCASKTHFVHAQKFAKEGNRTLFNKGDVKIRWQNGDEEGAQIMEQGPMCVIWPNARTLMQP